MMLSTEQKGPYENSKALEELMTQMIETIPELEDCEHFKIGLMYTNKSLSHGGRKVAARCSKVTAPVRFKTNLDYTIVVNSKSFFASTRDEQGATMIHELSHIKISEKSKNREILPALRPHEGDFCELPDHDRYSKGLYEKYANELTALKKVPLQEKL